jgi:heat shock protein HslJ
MLEKDNCTSQQTAATIIQTGSLKESTYCNKPFTGYFSLCVTDLMLSPFASSSILCNALSAYDIIIQP